MYEWARIQVQVRKKKRKKKQTANTDQLRFSDLNKYPKKRAHLPASVPQLHASLADSEEFCEAKYVVMCSATCRKQTVSWQVSEQTQRLI